MSKSLDFFFSKGSNNNGKKEAQNGEKKEEEQKEKMDDEVIPEKPLEKSTRKVKSRENTSEVEIIEDSTIPKPDPSKIVAEPIEKKLDYKKWEPESIELENFNPKKQSPFEKGECAPFFFICQCFDLVADMKGTNSVEKKKRVLINMTKTFELMSPSEAADFYLFATGRLDAEYIQEDLGVGNETMLKSCAYATGSTRAAIKEDVNKLGDLGKVIEERKSKTQTMDSFFTKKAADNRRVTVAFC